MAISAPPKLSDQLAQAFSAAHSKVSALELENAQLRAALQRFVDAFASLGFSPVQAASAPQAAVQASDAAPAQTPDDGAFLNDQPAKAQESTLTNPYADSVETIFPPDSQQASS